MLFYFNFFYCAGYNGVWLRQESTGSSGPCIPVTRRGQTSSAATQAETHQLHTTGELHSKIFYYQCLLVKTQQNQRCITWPQSFVVRVVSQRLDVERETIELVHTKPTETQDLPYRIPTDSPRYHFFIFKHSHQGQLQEALGQSTLSLIWQVTVTLLILLSFLLMYSNRHWSSITRYTLNFIIFTKTFWSSLVF